jgi:hypothetical protein
MTTNQEPSALDYGFGNLDDDQDDDTDDLEDVSISKTGPVTKEWKGVVHELAKGVIDWDGLAEDDRKLFIKLDSRNTARPTVLHRLAEDWGGEKGKQLSASILQGIIGYLLDKGMHFSENSQDPVLTVAMSYHNKASFGSSLSTTRRSFRSCLMLKM